MELLREAVAKRKNSVLISIFSLQNKKEQQAGTCFYFDEDSNQKGLTPFLREELLQESKQVLREGKSSFTKYDIDGKEFIAFTELIRPTPVLVIAGAGNDVVPLVAMADTIGWETIVADGRPLYAKKERFPVASCQVLLTKPEQILSEIEIDNRTAFVLMTHNYNYDLSMLRALLDKDIFYIGVLGPKKKMQMMLDELKAEGLKLDDEKLSRIHGPVGLNIGAETAEEIALSILAEIKSVLSSREPARLRDLNETIHSRSDLTIKNSASRKLEEGIK
jgi:xanthine/CO dehydrogenase XdhC/CoxF family maturation factor